MTTGKFAIITFIGVCFPSLVHSFDTQNEIPKISEIDLVPDKTYKTSPAKILPSGTYTYYRQNSPGGKEQELNDREQHLDDKEQKLDNKQRELGNKIFDTEAQLNDERSFPSAPPETRLLESGVEPGIYVPGGQAVRLIFPTEPTGRKQQYIRLQAELRNYTFQWQEAAAWDEPHNDGEVGRTSAEIMSVAMQGPGPSTVSEPPKVSKSTDTLKPKLPELIRAVDLSGLPYLQEGDTLKLRNAVAPAWYNTKHASWENLKSPNFWSSSNWLPTLKAQALARRSCIGFLVENSGYNSCSDVFDAFWEDQLSLKHHKFNAKYNAHSEDPSAKAIVLCGGIWVPAGANLGDTAAPAVVRSAARDAIVFEVSDRVLSTLQFINQGSQSADRGNGAITICFTPTAFPKPQLTLLRETVSDAQFTGDDGASSTVGTLSFISQPRLLPLNSTATQHLFRIPVRTFLEPGWRFSGEFKGHQFTPNVNLLAIKLGGCMGFAATHAYRITDVSKIVLSYTSTRRVLVSEEFDATANEDSVSIARNTGQEFELNPSRNSLNNGDVASSGREKYVSRLQSMSSLAQGAQQLVEETAHFVFLVDHKTEENDLNKWRVFAQGRERRKALEAIRAKRKRSAVKESNANNTLASTSIPNKVKGRPFYQTLREESLVVPFCRRFDLCFYASDQEVNGTKLGTIFFYADHEDSAELVGFVIFAVVGVPFIVGVTLSCYAYRHRKLRRNLRRLRLARRRDQIERQILHFLGIEGSSPTNGVYDEPFIRAT